MIKVLFVCLGNICRSPLAEGVFKTLVKRKNMDGKIVCDSAGTASYHIGANPDKRSCEVALKNSIILDHKGRQLCVKDFDEFDYIIAMDKSNYENICQVKAQCNDFLGKVFLMRQFDPVKDGEEVPDPYYGGMEGFEEVYQMLFRSNEKLLEHIIKENPHIHE